MLAQPSTTPTRDEGSEELLLVVSVSHPHEFHLVSFLLPPPSPRGPRAFTATPPILHTFQQWKERKNKKQINKLAPLTHTEECTAFRRNGYGTDNYHPPHRSEQSAPARSRGVGVGVGVVGSGETSWDVKLDDDGDEEEEKEERRAVFDITCTCPPSVSPPN